ncbi:MAG: proline dehydrogenase [Acidimicrobiia bacterium]|nr:proline dehydrogenase [Acidimicrobiia bacterium]
MTSSWRRRLLYTLAISDPFEAAVRKWSPLEDRAYRLLRRYVAGMSLDEAVGAIEDLGRKGLGVSLDLFGEGATDVEQVTRVVAGYRKAAETLSTLDADVYLEIVPSHLGLDIGLDLCRRQVAQVVEAMPPGARLEISAEEARRTTDIMELTTSLHRQGAPLVATLQANFKRSETDADRLVESGIPIRLVKGAYPEPPDVAHPWGEPTDVAYVRLAHRIHDGGGEAILATHDSVIRESLRSALGPLDIEMLYGVRPEIAAELVERDHSVRIYLPYGDGWFRYGMRRLAEAQGPSLMKHTGNVLPVEPMGGTDE